MDNSIKNNLCRSLRGCGVKKELALSILNQIEKWVDSSGQQWTVDRLKELKLWYEKSLNEDSPQPPKWHKHGKDNLPLGVWSHVFSLRNPQKVLAILSANTIFKAKRILPFQEKKFRDALEKDPLDNTLLIEQMSGLNAIEISMKKLSPPSFDSISGKSIPVSSEEGKIFTQPFGATPAELENLKVAAYCSSWQNVPLPTLRYLRRERCLDQVPPGLLVEGGEEGLFAVYPTQKREAGFVACIQEPSLKARWIANPNRIAQHYTGPLGDLWYDKLRSLKTDCTFNQESGVKWVQDQLQKGVTLSGADLSSATDLLDAELCVHTVSMAFFGTSLRDVEKKTRYESAVTHFLELSRMEWVFPKGGTVKWKRGQPLGLYPSFALLGLTNNMLGEQACQRAGIPKDSFRVIGDDIIMDSRALPIYTDLISVFGGEINSTKSITGARAAEFAGKVIFKDKVFHKTVKFKDMSDNSFMPIVSQLGDQSKSLLKPRQRKQYELFKFVPGFIVPGPYAQDSFGFSLENRYLWYLLKSNLLRERVIPDKEVIDSYAFAQKIYYHLSEVGALDEFEFSVPYTFGDDFQSSLASNVVHKGDPRLRDGKTCLEALETISSGETFQSFLDWMDHEETKKKELRSLQEIASEFRGFDNVKEELNHLPLTDQIKSLSEWIQKEQQELESVNLFSSPSSPIGEEKESLEREQILEEPSPPSSQNLVKKKNKDFSMGL